MAAQLFFGSLPVIGKTVLAVVPAIALVGIRTAITCAIFIVVQMIRGVLAYSRETPPDPRSGVRPDLIRKGIFSAFWLKERSDYRRFAVLSLFGVVLNQLFFIGGLSLTTASNTSLLAVMIPVFALAVGSLLGFERLTKIKIIGIILAAIGVIILIDPRKASFSSQTTLGDIFIVINCLAYGIYVATSREAIMRNGIFRSMMWVFIFASIVTVPLGVWSLSSIDIASVEPRIWWTILWIGIGATAAPYLLNAYALSKVDPSMVAVFVYLQPLIGFSLAVLFLGESITTVFIAAAVLIFAGVFLVTRKFAT